MKRLTLVMVVFLLAAALVPALAWAPATRDAIHATAKVLARLDPANPPNYANEGFLDRAGLTTGVIQVLEVMVADNTTPADWCPLVHGIIDNDPRYFDASINPNPARDEFVRDWLRVARKASCIRG